MFLYADKGPLCGALQTETIITSMASLSLLLPQSASQLHISFDDQAQQNELDFKLQAMATRQNAV